MRQDKEKAAAVARHYDEALLRRQFNEYFSRSTLRATDALWRAFKLWQGKKAMSDFAEFEKNCNEAREQARAVMDAWSNPLPNAKKGEPYEAVFRVPTSRFKLGRLPDIGLELTIDDMDPQKCTVRGTPSASGDYEILLLYIWEGWTKGLPFLEHRLRLTVIPDPREMWQDIPSDQSLEYARPDWEFSHVNCDKARMWAASLRGRSHAHAGQFRDDAFAITCAAGWQLLAVSDGAGSAPFSRQGAALACDAAITSCAAELSRSNALEAHLLEVNPVGTDWQAQAKKLAYHVFAAAAFEAHKAIRHEAESKNREVRDYAATLLLAGVRKLPHAWAVCSFQVGDGAITMIDARGGRMLASPDEGEFGGQTRFITMQEIFDPTGLMARLGVAVTTSLEGVLLVTDGITDARFGARQALESAGLWKDLWRQLLEVTAQSDAEAAAREWLGFWAKGSHDDRTFVLMQVGDGN